MNIDVVLLHKCINPCPGILSLNPGLSTPHTLQSQQVQLGMVGMEFSNKTVGCQMYSVAEAGVNHWGKAGIS